MRETADNNLDLSSNGAGLDAKHKNQVHAISFFSLLDTRKKVKDGRMTNASQPPKGPPSDLTLVLMYTIAPPIGELRPKKHGHQLCVSALSVTVPSCLER